MQPSPSSGTPLELGPLDLVFGEAVLAADLIMATQKNRERLVVGVRLFFIENH